MVARLIAPVMSRRLVQQVVVDNRGGGAGIIGTGAVARSPANGYTVALVLDTHAVNLSLYRDIPYNSVRDFAPVTLVGRTPLLLVAHPSLSAANVAELVALLKQRPGSVAFASIGSGSIQNHLAAEVFMARAGVEMLHVRYRGGGPAVQDLLGGQVATVSLGHLEPPARSGWWAQGAGGLRRTTPPRSARRANDGGTRLSRRGGRELSFRSACAGGHPGRCGVTRLQEAVAEAVTAPEVGQRFAQLGIQPDVRGPSAFSDFMRAEIDKWATVIRTANIQVD